jgi:uncharacterized protein (UPF0261 family)
MDMVNFWALDTVPDKFRQRTLHQHNQNVTLMRTNAQECAQIGQWLAHQLNKMTGPVAMLVPLGGFSALDTPGGEFCAPEANLALTEQLQKTFVAGPKRQLQLEPHHINAPEFAQALVRALRQVLPSPPTP